MLSGAGGQQLVRDVHDRRRGGGEPEGHRTRGRRNVGLTHVYDVSLPVEYRTPGITRRVGASVCIKSTSGAPVEAEPGIWRCSPEMMPEVTVS